MGVVGWATAHAGLRHRRRHSLRRLAPEGTKATPAEIETPAQKPTIGGGKEETVEEQPYFTRRMKEKQQRATGVGGETPGGTPPYQGYQG